MDIVENDKEIEAVLKEVIVIAYRKYESDLLHDLSKINDIPNLAVAKIREYSRKWNDEFPDFPDVFLKGFKITLFTVDWPDNFENAFRYL